MKGVGLMIKNIYDISKNFNEFYESLEDLLNTACEKAKKDGNADIMQKIVDLSDTSRFIFADFLQFNELLEDVKNYLKPQE